MGNKVERKISIVEVIVFMLMMLGGYLVIQSKLDGDNDIMVYTLGMFISVCYALGTVYCVRGLVKSVKESLPGIKTFFERLNGVSDNITDNIKGKK